MATLFYLRGQIHESARRDCLTLFGGMSREDDERDAGKDVQTVGRWSSPGDGVVFCVCRASTAKALHGWLLKWTAMATISAVPVVDDDQLRAIVADARQGVGVEYDAAGSPGSEENLYAIEYAFRPGLKTSGLTALAGMDEDALKEDQGKNRMLGRWHDIASGTGLVVCASASEEELQQWAFKWADLCDCRVSPVLTDVDAREVIQGQPGFKDRHGALIKKLSPSSSRWNMWSS